MKRTRRAVASALTVVALAVGLVVLTPASAPGPTAPRAAEAGVGYWSQSGCSPQNASVWWNERASNLVYFWDYDWPQQSQVGATPVRDGILGLYHRLNNECGQVGAPRSSEYPQPGGADQEFEWGWIHWDVHCYNHAYVRKSDGRRVIIGC